MGNWVIDEKGRKKIFRILTVYIRHFLRLLMYPQLEREDLDYIISSVRRVAKEIF